jgi:hypothetical protein
MKKLLFIIFSIITLSSCGGSQLSNDRGEKRSFVTVQCDGAGSNACSYVIASTTNSPYGSGQVSFFQEIGDNYSQVSTIAMDRCKNWGKNQSKKINCFETFSKKSTNEIQQEEINRKSLIAASAKKQKQDQCKDLGFTEGTENFGMCILKLMEIEATLAKNSSDAAASQALANELKKKRQQEAGDALLGISESLLGGSSITETLSGKSSSGSSTSVSCYKTDETISGTNKICYYSCTGSTVTTNVGAAQQCPITINR